MSAPCPDCHDYSHSGPCKPKPAQEWTNIEVAQWLQKSKPELVAALAAEREKLNINLEVAESAGKVAKESLQLRSEIAAEREKLKLWEEGERPMIAEVQQLRSQNAALVEALEKLIRAAESRPYGFWSEAIIQGKAALAKAKVDK